MVGRRPDAPVGAEMKALLLHKFAAEYGGPTDSATREWLRKHQLLSAHFNSESAAITYAQHAIRSALDAEASDRSLLFSEGVEREYDHDRGAWQEDHTHRTTITYMVPYRERFVDIDWATETVTRGEWTESAYSAIREICIETVLLTIYDETDNPANPEV